MSELQGFMVFDFDEGVASMSVTQNGITFNKSTVIKLDYPTHAVLLINAEQKQIAVQACSSDTPKAAVFYKEQDDDKPVRSVRWNSKDLLNRISQIMGWDLKQMGYRIEGRLLPADHAILFDLTKAQELN